MSANVNNKNKLNSINKFIQKHRKDLYVEMQKPQTAQRARREWDVLEELTIKLNSKDVSDDLIDKIYNRVEKIKKKEEEQER